MNAAHLPCSGHLARSYSHPQYVAYPLAKLPARRRSITCMAEASSTVTTLRPDEQQDVRAASSCGPPESSEPTAPSVGANQGGKRAMCSRCDRPVRTCLCSALPDNPLKLRGRIIILRHPFEKKKPLATVPVLSKCIHDSCIAVVHHRQFSKGLSTQADELLQLTQDGLCPLYILYPGKEAECLPEVSECEAHISALESADAAAAAAEASCGASNGAEQGTVPAAQAGAKPAYVLFVIDGTWRQAKEMFNGSSSLLLPPNGAGRLVLLPLAGPEAAAPDEKPSSKVEGQSTESAAAGTQEACLIRKEPVEGYLLTHEAVARALALLERDPSVCDVIMEPLKLMTRYQAMHDPAVKARNAWAVQGIADGGSEDKIVGKKRPMESADDKDK